MYRPKYLDTEKTIETIMIHGEVIATKVIKIGRQGKRGDPPSFDADRYKRKFWKGRRGVNAR